MQRRLSCYLRAWLAILAIASIGLGQTNADAATPPMSDRLKPMRVYIARDARPGCASACLAWIAAEGKITPGTRTAFERTFRALGTRHLPIFIDSGGGLVTDAMVIGRMIRARRLDVVVTQSLPEPCAIGIPCGSKHADTPARPQGAGALCASACTLILAAGTHRFAGPKTWVGVHQMINNGTRIWKQKLFRVLTRTVGGVKVVVDRTQIGERLVKTEHYTAPVPKPLYDHVQSYLMEMGIKPEIMPLMLATAPSAVHWLSRGEMRSTALVTDDVDGEALADAARAVEPNGKGPHLAVSPPDEAMQVEPAGDAPRQTIALGHVTWTLDRQSGQAATDDPLVLGAHIDIPQAHTSLDLRVVPADGNPEGPLRVDMTFWTPNHTLAKIRSLWPLQARSDAPLQITPLPGKVTMSMTGTYTMMLDRQTDGAPTTVMLMNRRWIVIPMLIDGLQFVDVRFEHAASATPLLARAFASWTHAAAVAARPKGDPPKP